MDTLAVRNRVSLLERGPLNQSTHPTGDLLREAQAMFLTRPPFLWKARRFNEEGTTCQSAKANSCSTAQPTNNYFYLSCDQDCLRKMLLMTATAIFLRTEQNNSNC